MHELLGNKSMPESRSILAGNAVVLMLALALTIMLAACTMGPQFSSEVEHKSLTLQPNDLERHGIGFLTPSAATGQETNKQSLSLMFADELTVARSEVRVAALPEVLSAVNGNGLAQEYKQMYRDYLETGILEQKTLREIGRASGVRYLAQLSLAGFDQGGSKRFGFLGLRLVDTKTANMHVFMQIWDGETGEVAWEGTEEVSFAYDTSTEKPVTFKTIAEMTARELFAVLPGADPELVVAYDPDYEHLN